MSIEQILDDTKSELSVADQQTFLHRYNYFEGLVQNARAWSFAEVKKQLNSKTPEFKEAITRFQLFYGLPATGIMDEETQRWMTRPRCACPDFQPEVPDNAEKAVAKWPIDQMNGVTYACKLDQLNLGITESTRIFKLAGEAWNKVCGIGLKFSTNYGSANINAEDARIDNKWSILAWSELSTGRADARLQQRYDTMEQWDFDFLLAVAIHEIGHALGWHHLNRRDSILFPSWQRHITEPQPVDIERAVKDYGRPEGGDPDDPQPPPSDRLTRLELRVDNLEKLMKLILQGMS